MATKAEVIQKLVEPVINALGYQLWGLEYLGQGKHTLLRIFIEKEGGINIEDCAETSRQVSSILDVEDPIKDEYTLEVSSPGLDRQLFRPEQYMQYPGAMVKVRLNGNLNGRRNFAGTLQEVISTQEETIVVIKVGAEEFRLPFQMIEKANVVIPLAEALQSK
ncbi:MAG: ribosome maturation factor RimP [Pseudomonadota bacterium]